MGVDVEDSGGRRIADLEDPAGAQTKADGAEAAAIAEIGTRGLDAGGDFTGTIDGTAAGTVKDQAADAFQKSADTLDDVDDGATYKRATANEKTGAGRAYSALDANNQLVDQRKAPAITVANRRSLQRNYAGASVVYSEAPAAKTWTTVRVRAHDLRIGTVDVSYDAGFVSPLAYSTLYYVYTDDPTLAGGAATYEVTTDPDTVYSDEDRYYIGKTMTPAAESDPDNDGEDGAGDEGIQ